MRIFNLPRIFALPAAILTTTLLCPSAKAGGYISDKTDDLVAKTFIYLIKNGYCPNKESCSKEEHVFFFVEESTRIYLNIYDQLDNLIAGGIAKFFLDEGLRITEGKPISLGVFRGLHSEYEGLSNAFFRRRHAALELEVSQ